VALFQGELACVQRELFVVFELWFSLLELCFFSDVSSSSDLALCLCLAFDRLLEFLFIRFFFFFSLLLLYVGVVNALIKEEIEDHVWFEDWWMVASLCDE
jgi:hypothetical protein